MARRTRNDVPGSWHHVMNRGIARRTVFESRADMRYFLSRLAREVRARRIEVHCFSLMTTHYHLLVRSPVGELSEAMRRVQNIYVRYFNRSRRRDGSLFRGRFLSKHVDSEIYRRVVARYIDHNQVSAGLSASPWEYPWGSALAYVYRKGPSWLQRDWLENVVTQSAEEGETMVDAYRRRMGRSLGEGARRWVEARTLAHPSEGSRHDDMLLSAPDSVLDWMKRKADLADGSSLGVPLADAETIDALTAAYPFVAVDKSVSGRAANPKFVLRVALLRDVASCDWNTIAERTKRANSTCWAAYRKQHPRLLEESPAYAQALERVGASSIRRMLRDL